MARVSPAAPFVKERLEWKYCIRAARDWNVHKDVVVARVRCVSEPRADETRSFATTTGALIELQEWLSSHSVTHVAMEVTGVYWRAAATDPGAA